MNTNMQTEPTEIWEASFHLNNLGSVDNSERRSAESYLMDLSTKGEDFRILMAIITSAEKIGRLC